MKSKRELRKHDLEATKNNTSLLRLPIVAKGTLTAINKFAQNQGFTWKADKRMLFGGYYVDTASENLDCFYIT